MPEAFSPITNARGTVTIQGTYPDLYAVDFEITAVNKRFPSQQTVKGLLRPFNYSTGDIFPSSDQDVRIDPVSLTALRELSPVLNAWFSTGCALLGMYDQYQVFSKQLAPLQSQLTAAQGGLDEATAELAALPESLPEGTEEEQAALAEQRASLQGIIDANTALVASLTPQVEALVASLVPVKQGLGIA